MNDAFYFHVYCSTASVAFSQSDLFGLLEKSRKKNLVMGLTGMLLYKNSDFMQALEGPEKAVRATLKQIRNDPRHNSITSLIEGYTEKREFPSWQMGFNDLETDEIRRMPGYSEFLNTPLSVGLTKDPSACERLLHLFKKRLR